MEEMGLPQKYEQIEVHVSGSCVIILTRYPQPSFPVAGYIVKIIKQQERHSSVSCMIGFGLNNKTDQFENKLF